MLWRYTDLTEAVGSPSYFPCQSWTEGHALALESLSLPRLLLCPASYHRSRYAALASGGPTDPHQFSAAVIFTREGGIYCLLAAAAAAVSSGRCRKTMTVSRRFQHGYMYIYKCCFRSSDRSSTYHLQIIYRSFLRHDDLNLSRNMYPLPIRSMPCGSCMVCMIY